MYNEPKEVWIGQRRRHYRKLQILTPSENVVEFERHGTRGILRVITLFEFTFKKAESKMLFSA